MSDGERPGGICGDKLDIHLGPRAHCASSVAAGGNLTNQVAEVADPEMKVDKPRRQRLDAFQDAGQLRFAGGLDVGGELRGDVDGLGAKDLGELETGRSGQVAMAGVARHLDYGNRLDLAG